MTNFNDQFKQLCELYPKGEWEINGWSSIHGWFIRCNETIAITVPFEKGEHPSAKRLSEGNALSRWITLAHNLFPEIQREMERLVANVTSRGERISVLDEFGMRTHLYSDDEQAVVDSMKEQLGENFAGGGNDPISFLIACHTFAIHERNESWAELSAKKEEVEKLKAQVAEVNAIIRNALNTHGSQVVASSSSVHCCPVSSMCENTPNHEPDCWLGQALRYGARELLEGEQ